MKDEKLTKIQDQDIKAALSISSLTVKRTSGVRWRSLTNINASGKGICPLTTIEASISAKEKFGQCMQWLQSADLIFTCLKFSARCKISKVAK